MELLPKPAANVLKDQRVRKVAGQRSEVRVVEAQVTETHHLFCDTEEKTLLYAQRSRSNTNEAEEYRDGLRPES